jgi:hypothetical protein
MVAQLLRLSSSDRQVTVSETGAGYVSAAVVVLLTLASPAAYVLVNRLFIRIWKWCEGWSTNTNQQAGPGVGSSYGRSEGDENDERASLNTSQQAGPDSRVGNSDSRSEDEEINDESPLIPPPPRESYYPVIRKKWKSSHAPDFSDSAIQDLWRISKKMLTHRPRRPKDPEDSGTKLDPDEPREMHVGFSWSNLSARKVDVLVLILILTFCYTIFGLLIWGGIESSNIVSDTVALSASKDCGFWNPDPKAPPKENGTTGHLYLQEVEAAEYAEHCYRAPQGTDGCNFFTTQDIPYDVIKGDECPFSDELCLNGRKSAFTMTTKLVSSKALGINVPKGYLFRRTTTCSPVSRDGYVLEQGGNFEYNYGPIVGLRNSTWITPNKSQKIFPGYEVA